MKYILIISSHSCIILYKRYVKHFQITIQNPDHADEGGFLMIGYILSFTAAYLVAAFVLSFAVGSFIHIGNA